MVRVYLVGLVLVLDDFEDIESVEWCAWAKYRTENRARASLHGQERSSERAR